jgi:hypothetical protein
MTAFLGSFRVRGCDCFGLLRDSSRDSRKKYSHKDRDNWGSFVHESALNSCHLHQMYGQSALPTKDHCSWIHGLCIRICPLELTDFESPRQWRVRRHQSPKLGVECALRHPSPLSFASLPMLRDLPNTGRFSRLG